jgi:hypothetical protein
MKMKRIPDGEFLMGSPDGDDQAFDNEKPSQSRTEFGDDWCRNRRENQNEFTSLRF